MASVIAAVHDAACRRTRLLGGDVGDDHDTVAAGGSGDRKQCLLSISRVARRDRERQTELESAGSSLAVNHSGHATPVDVAGLSSLGCRSLISFVLLAPV